jgi:hypothetical protein
VVAVPHPCQNAPMLRVIGGHSRDVHRRGDLGSSRYQRRVNKPDKEEVRGSNARSPTTRLASSGLISPEPVRVIMRCPGSFVPVCVPHGL